MTAEAAGAAEADTSDSGTGVPPERMFHGHVIIEWPEPYRGEGGCLQGWKVTAYDAGTGECISSTAELMTLTVNPSDWVVAEMTHLLGPDGQPPRQEPADPVTGKVPPSVLEPGEDGKFKTGVFRYLVAGMRVQS